MITIWKFPLKVTREQTFSVPRDPKPLHVGFDGDGMPCLWCQVLTTNDMVDMPVAIVGTGHHVPMDAVYRGTFTQGAFVWHVFTRR